jgi:hypothetical protein
MARAHNTKLGRVAKLLRNFRGSTMHSRIPDIDDLHFLPLFLVPISLRQDPAQHVGFRLAIFDAYPCHTSFNPDPIQTMFPITPASHSYATMTNQKLLRCLMNEIDL